MTAPVVELFPNEAPQAPSPQRQANDEEWKWRTSVEVRLGNHDTRLASHEHRLDRLWDFGTKVALLFAGVIVGRVTAPQAQETSASSGGGRAQVSAAGASVAASTPATLPPSPALPPPASAQPPAAARVVPLPVTMRPRRPMCRALQLRRSLPPTGQPAATP